MSLFSGIVCKLLLAFYFLLYRSGMKLKTINTIQAVLYRLKFNGTVAPRPLGYFLTIWK